MNAGNIINALFKGALAKVSKLPVTPNLITLNLSGQVSQWSTGLYLVKAPKLGGKSIVSRSVAAAAAAQTVPNVGVLSVFEPGSPRYVRSASDTGGETTIVFADPRKFMTVDGLGELDTVVKSSGYKPDKLPGMLIIDSISDPMRGFMPEARAGQGAAAQGMQPADQLFVKTLDRWALEQNLIVLGPTNDELVPFIGILEGACQGMVEINSITTFTKRERATGRVPHSYTINEKYTRIALAAMGYPEKLEHSTTQKDFVTHI